MLWYNYNMDDDKKTFNHDKASVADKIRLISELEHIRAHALRSAASTLGEERDDSEFKRGEESTRYLIIAKQAQTLRRDYMRKHFSTLKDTDWCLCKAAACLRQIAYEVCEGDVEELREIDDFVDEIWGEALDMDLSDCVACREDRDSSEEA
jgi:hypothetical protein